jgi:hypothetical protein
MRKAEEWEEEWRKAIRRDQGLMLPATRMALIRQIQADSRRQGMLDAAEIAAKQSAIMPHYSDIERGYAQGRGEAANAITQSAAEQRG